MTTLAPTLHRIDFEAIARRERQRTHGNAVVFVVTLAASAAFGLSVVTQ